MKKNNLYLLFCPLLSVLLSLPAFSQIKVSGQVTDTETGEPLPYVNIGIKGANTGTISNASGHFSLSIPEFRLVNDSLTFYTLGYKETNLFIPSLSEEEALDISLQPMPIPLKEVRLSAKKWKEKTIGVKNASPLLHGMATSRAGDILEIAQPIKVRKKPLQLLTASLYLNSAGGDSCTFRIKIYADADGQPGDLLIAENVLIRQKAEKGWLTAELKELDIIMKEDFFVSFEFIPDEHHKTTSLVYGGQFGKGRGFSRSSSLGEWEAAPCSYAIQALVAVQQ